MSKSEADSLKKISTNFLKKHSYFIGSYYGIMTWTINNNPENKSSVGLESRITNDDSYIRIYYTQTDNYSGEKKDFDYKIPLTTTPCRYGGKRYWFICPMSRNDMYCGKRVGTIYKNGDYFACRHCYNLTYVSRNASIRHRGFVSIPDVDEALKEVKTMFYRGNLTRKYKRYIKLRRRFMTGFIRTTKHLSKQVGRSF